MASTHSEGVAEGSRVEGCRAGPISLGAAAHEARQLVELGLHEGVRHPRLGVLDELGARRAEDVEYDPRPSA